MKPILVAIAVVLALILAGCSSPQPSPEPDYNAGGQVQGEDDISDDVGINNSITTIEVVDSYPASDINGDDFPDSNETVAPAADPNPPSDPEPVSAGNLKEFNITARNWEFIPSTIEVDLGDTVRLHVTSEDVEHGFSILQFGVSENILRGETVDIEFVANKAGIYTFQCNVFCGSGHSGMKGKLVVK